MTSRLCIEIIRLMKIFSQSILPELEGWEERLALVLQSVDQNRTIGKPREKGGVRKNASPKRTKSQIEADFWFRVKISSPEECWEWTGTISEGYGRVSVRGKYDMAHRFSSAYRYGETSGEFFTCHHCDNRACCNPHHFFIGTVQDNLRDMTLKGRANHAKGETHVRATLSNDDVLSIRKEAKNRPYGWMSMKARYLGVTPQLIRLIVHNRCWKHLILN